MYFLEWYHPVCWGTTELGQRLVWRKLGLALWVAGRLTTAHDTSISSLLDPMAMTAQAQMPPSASTKRKHEQGC